MKKMVLWMVGALLLQGVVRAHETGDLLLQTAQRFLSTLSPEQRAKAVLPLSSTQRENWHFVPDHSLKEADKRSGITWKELKPFQRPLALAVLQGVLSQRGFLEASTIMTLEQVLHEAENQSPNRDPENYYLAFYGEPEAEGFWALRFEGHHLSINLALQNGVCVAATPSFFGSNPGEVRTPGLLQGLRNLAEEEDLARALISSFSETQKSQAIIEAKAPRDILTGQAREAERNQFLPAKGIPMAALSSTQQDALRALVEVYVKKYRPELRADLLGEAPLLPPSSTFFAWAGSVEPKAGHYYRVQTPRFLFEYDNTQNGANHVHAVWRDFDGDFGRDILWDHLKKEHP